MDAKSLAKSKRAHSLHHSKKPHSIKNPKATSGGTGASAAAGSGNKALGKQVKEKARQSGLPSNWDRYEEEEFEGSGAPSGDSMNKYTDVCLPKSKGADYSHLIAEAQSHSSLDSFLSLDDIFPGDYKIGVGPILSVRGEAILSWIGDENFVVYDERSGNPEAPFLSLNLNALAEQLEKVKLSDRLYVEPDLLPPELVDDCRGTTVDGSESDRVGAEARTEFEELVLEDLSKEKNTEALSSRSSVTVRTSSDSFIQQSDILNQTTDDLNKKPSTFEATAAEAELDMLLDSFNESKFLGSPGDTFSVSQKGAPSAQPHFTRVDPSSFGTKTFTAELDDVLDDLLEESSNSSNQNVSGQLGKVTASSNEIRPSSSMSVSKSKVLEDFDSWLDTI